MCDNLQNEWGVKLIQNNIKTRNSINEHINQVEIINTMNDLCSPFEVDCFQISGTSANFYAIGEASCNNMENTLVACGSYVSGEKSAQFRAWSSSNTDITKELSLIETRKDYLLEAALKRTIPLPYYIRCDDINELELQEYETLCFNELNRRCILEMSRGNKPSCLFMEIMLAGSGATIRDEFLTKLGKLCKSLKINIVVDEVMTSVRTGNMLLTNDVPLEFQEVVSHITIGKWFGRGCVLRNKKHIFVQGPKEVETSLNHRGPSNALSHKETLGYVRSLHQAIVSVSNRRKQVIRRCKLDDKNTWGKGCMIFSTKTMKNNFQGLKCRYLPQLCECLPIDFSSGGHVKWTKTDLCRQTMERVKEWIKISYQQTNHIDRLFLNQLEHIHNSQNTEDKYFHTSSLKYQLKESIENCQKKDMSAFIDRLNKIGLIRIKRKGASRIRSIVFVENKWNF